MTDRKAPPHRKPVSIARDEDAAQTPDTAPPPPDAAELPQGRAMQRAAVGATRRMPAAGKVLAAAATALAGLALSVAAWDFAGAMIARNTALGTLALGLLAALALAAFALAVREWAGLHRLRRLDGLRRRAEAALAADDLAAARATIDGLDSLYAQRPELRWGRARLAERIGDSHDADTAMILAEQELLAPLDTLARREAEAAARQVAVITALVPMALADVAAALIANMRMIRRIAEIYGGRAGTLGSWRLTRTVLTHLVATGAISAGDDLLGSFAGGGIVSRLSRRFGEGVVNGALTARVGVAAMEVCRPLPFRHVPRPRVGDIMRRAVSGLFTN